MTKPKRKYHKKQPLKIVIPTPEGNKSIFDVKDMKESDWDIAREFVKLCKNDWERYKKFRIEQKKLEIKQKELELKILESWFERADKK